MQEYHSRNHASPLIVLKHMRLSYFKDDTSTGYYVCTSLHNTRRFDRMDLILDMVLHQLGGDFQFTIKRDSHEMRLQTTDSLGNTLHYMTAWDFRWKDCIKALIKIQRFVIAKKLQKVGCTPNQDTFKIQSLIQFKKFQLLPSDIMDYIIDLYFDPNDRK
jgi:hypothetical protein